MSAEIHKLSNGATIIIDHMPGAHTSALSYTFAVGSRHEKPEENGLAHFLEHMAFKGTENHSAFSLNRTMDKLGARSNAFTSREVTSYYMAGLNEDVIKFNDIQFDMASRVTLPAEEIEKERGVILEEIKSYADDPGSVMEDVLQAAMYPDQAYGRTILGPASNIKKFERSSFNDFRNRHYNHAGNLIVSFAGGADPSLILNDIERRVLTIPKGERSLYEPASYKGGFIAIEKPDLEQVSLCLAFEASKIGAPDSMAQAIMNTILSNGMSSRLHDEVREKLGLVYTIESYIPRSFDTGTLQISAGLAPENVSALIPVLSNVLKDMRDKKVTDEELEMAKRAIRVSAAFSNDANSSSRIENNMFSYSREGRIEGHKEYMDRVQSVSREDVLDAAQKVFSSKPSYASVGSKGLNEREQIAANLEIDL